MSDKIPFWQYAQHPPPRVSRVTGIALVVFLGVFFFFGLPRLWHWAGQSYVLVSKGLAVPGVVLPGYGEYGGTPIYDPQVEYQAPGGGLLRTTARRFWGYYAPGVEVRVLYDPLAPPTAEIENEGLFIPWVLLLLSPLAVYGIFRLIKASWKDEPTPTVKFSKQTNRFMNRLFLGLFLLFCLYECSRSVLDLADSYRLATKGVETRGTVEKNVRWRLRWSCLYFSVVAFTDGQGLKHEFLTRADFFGTNVPALPGGQVRVFYDPRNPKKALAQDSYDLWECSLGILALSLVPLAWFLAEGVIPRLRKKNRAAYEVILGGG